MAKREKQTQPKKPTTTSQFRIYPTKKHIRILNEWLALCCEVYNAALDERTGYPRFKSRFRYAYLSTGEEIANPRFFRREEAALVVRVNPAYTSRTCSACGHRQPMPLSVRVYECPHVVWSSSATIMGVSIAYPMLFKPVDEQAESFQKPPATSRGESSRVHS